MGAAAPVHPDDETLQSYGLGKLDEALAASVKRHLELCADCRRRVAEVPSDSFLGRLKGAAGRADPSGPLVSSDTWLSMLGANANSTAPSPADTLPPGLVHPDYEVIRELGQGGMGTVYLAQNRLMGRHEVLKVVSSHLIKRRGVMDRFLSEIRNAARLHHTNIVTAYSASRLGESIIFAMEYVDGLDLAKLVMAKGPFPVAHACNYVYQAALGLQHAHEHGMVHRDIKPSNLILAPQGGRAVIKVLDFGLAKIQSEGAIDGGLTQDGQMLGTPDFVAPEQIGDARRADIRADIYSLGCTLYYLLTGGPPFKATSLYEILQAHHSMDALPLNLARPEVPAELAALVARMMAKEPELRFQTPNEVAQALKPFFKPASFESVNRIYLSPARRTWWVICERRRYIRRRTSRINSPLETGGRGGGRVAVWERLIDLGEPDPLTDAPPVIAAPARPTPPWPMIIGLSILGAAILAGVVGYMTSTNDRNVLVPQSSDNRVPQAENAKSPVVASSEETSDFTQTDSSFGTPNPLGQRDPVAASSANANNKSQRLPAPADEKPSAATPAPLASQVRVDPPAQAAQKPDQKPMAGSPVADARVVSPEERLLNFGLERAGKVFILTQEADLEQKFRKARPVVQAYRADFDMRIQIQQAGERIQQLEQFIPQLDFNIRGLNVQLGRGLLVRTATRKHISMKSSSNATCSTNNGARLRRTCKDSQEPDPESGADSRSRDQDRARPDVVPIGGRRVGRDDQVY